MSVELATAYISLVPSMRGAGAKIRSELTGSEVASATTVAGRAAGANLGTGIATGVQPGLNVLRTGLTSELTATSRQAGSVIGGNLGAGIAAGLSNLSASKLTLGSVGAVVGGAGLLSFLKSATDEYVIAAREAIKFQRVTGASAQDASALSAVAQQSGVDVDQLALSFVRLSKSADTTKGQSALSKLGISLKDANGDALPLVGQLSAIADGFARSSNTAAKNAAANDLFGRGIAINLLPLLNKGASGIDDVVQKAKELGLVFDQSQLDGVKKYTFAQRDLVLTLRGLKAQVGEEIFPGVAAGLERTADAAVHVVSVFTALPGPVKTAAVDLTGLAGVGLVLFGAGGLMIRGVQLAAASWGSLGAGIRGAGAAAAVAEPELAGASAASATGGAGAAGAGAAGAAAPVAATGVRAAISAIALPAAALIGANLGYNAALSKLHDISGEMQHLASIKATDPAAVLNQLNTVGLSNRDTLANRVGNFFKGASITGPIDAKDARVEIDNISASVSNLDAALGEYSKVADFDSVAKGLLSIKTAIANPANKGQVEDLKNIYSDYVGKLKDASAAELANGGAAGPATHALQELGISANDASGSVNGTGDALQGTATKSAALDTALSRLQTGLKVSSAGFDLAKTRADAFGTGLDRASGFDNLLGSAVKLGSTLQTFRQGLSPTEDSLKSTAKSTDLVAEAQSRLSDVIQSTNPSLSAQGIALDSISAGADAFSKSLSSGFGGNAVTTAIDLGDAYRSFRDTLHQLPRDIDTSGAALGRYGDLQDGGIRNLLKLGSATRDYLTNLVRQGESAATVRAEAARLNDAYARQLVALGLNSDQLQSYLKLLGTTPEQIDTAIRLSEVEKSRFELNAYIGLLQGKIPPEVATTVIAQVQSGNLEAASATLANFAKTNPVKIDTNVAVNEDSLKKAADSIQFRLPKTIDLRKVITGGYDKQTLSGIQQAQDALGATADVLKTTVENGASLPEVLAQASTLRSALSDVFTQAGASADTVQQLFTSAGLQDTQITYSFTTAGFEETVAKLNLLNSLLGDKDKPSAGVQREISLKIAQGDLQGASDLLSRWVVDAQDGLIQDPLLVHLTEPDTKQADSGFQAWKDAKGNESITTPAYVDVAPGDAQLDEWKLTKSQQKLVTTVDAAIDQAQTAGQFDQVAALLAAKTAALNADPSDDIVISQVLGQYPNLAPVLTLLQAEADAQRIAIQFDQAAATVSAVAVVLNAVAAAQTVANNVVKWATPPDAATTGGAYSGSGTGGPYPPGRDNNTWTPYALGGPLGGVVPGNRSLGDIVPAITPQGPIVLTGEEYVLRASAVDRIGIPTLDRLNAGDTTIHLGQDKSLRHFATGGSLDPTGRWTPPLAALAPAVPAVGMPMVSVGPTVVEGDTTNVEVKNYGPGPLDVAEIPAAIRRDRFLRGRRSDRDQQRSVPHGGGR